MKKSVDDELIAEEPVEVKTIEVEDQEEFKKTEPENDSIPALTPEPDIDMSYYPLEYLIPIDWDNLEQMETISANAREELVQFEEAKNASSFSDELLTKIIRKKLQSKPCQNQGFVLDGIPIKIEQVKALFASNQDEAEDQDEKKFSFDSALLPDVVVFLKAEDKTLYQRIKNRYLNSLKSDKTGFSAAPNFYSLDNLETDPNYQSVLQSFQKRLREYKCSMNPEVAARIRKRRSGNSKYMEEAEEEEENNERVKEEQKASALEETNELLLKLPNDPDAIENNVLAYFDVREVYPLVIDLDRDNSSRMLLGNGAQVDTFKKVCREMGLPSKPLTTLMEDQLLEALSKNKHLDANRKSIADGDIANSILIAEWENWLQLVRKEVTERQTLKLMPMRHYLMQTAMPSLIDALFECNSVRPKDPIEFIANFMINAGVKGR
ncbi:Adenylate kinase 7 [Cichlidogyrus casuarinus]|uniref:Adenylate kinase 7 n=1 Tax=Cichlidogyrus casuarinus TaxID=1844966 RepID=A0ABD2QHU1_9PLAT